MNERYDPIVDQNHESTREVFEALLSVSDVPNQDKAKLVLRWQEAEAAERRLRNYNAEYDRSLLGVTRFGQ